MATKESKEEGTNSKLAYLCQDPRVLRRAYYFQLKSKQRGRIHSLKDVLFSLCVFYSFWFVLFAEFKKITWK